MEKECAPLLLPAALCLTVVSLSYGSHEMWDMPGKGRLFDTRPEKATIWPGRYQRPTRQLSLYLRYLCDGGSNSSSNATGGGWSSVLSTDDADMSAGREHSM